MVEIINKYEEPAPDDELLFDEDIRDNDPGQILFLRLLEVIKKISPSRNYDYEQPYQIELNGWLKAHFPDNPVNMEVQLGSSRPDIVVDSIAIEIKGPTSAKDLETIYGKCHRYQEKFDNMVVVLFDVQMDDDRYLQWAESIRQYFPDVEIIKI